MVVYLQRVKSVKSCYQKKFLCTYVPVKLAYLSDWKTKTSQCQKHFLPIKQITVVFTSCGFSKPKSSLKNGNFFIWNLEY